VTRAHPNYYANKRHGHGNTNEDNISECAKPRSVAIGSRMTLLD